LPSQLIDIYQDFAERYGRPHATLGEAFEAKFGVSLDGVILNALGRRPGSPRPAMWASAK